MARKATLSLVEASNPSTVEQAGQVFLTDCHFRKLSPRTIEMNTLVLRQLAAHVGQLPLEQVDAQTLRAYIIEVSSRCSAATAARYFESMQAFFRFLASNELLADNPMRNLAKPKAPKPIIEPLSQEDVEALIACCGTDLVGQRDRLVLLLLIDCGLRASELAALTPEDVDMDNQLLLIRHGKGDKSRRVPFGQAVAAALRQWLPRHRDLPADTLIVNCYGESTDRYGLRHIVRKCAKKAGLEGKFGPHLLRHTCAVSYLRAGGDVFSLQKILGHADLTMTRRYTELADSDVQNKHRLFSPADRLRMQEQTSRKRLR